jgi:hypothetical protein
MTGILQNKHLIIIEKYVLLDTTDFYTCSFTEFIPFCLKLYYFSNFKDFNTLAQA